VAESLAKQEGVMHVAITEYLRIDLDAERWQCRRCEHDLVPPADNYKRGLLVHDRDPREIHRSILDSTCTVLRSLRIRAGAASSSTIAPGAGTQVETSTCRPDIRRRTTSNWTSRT